MNQIGEANWPHNIPNGPLTRQHFDLLSVSFYDAGATQVQRVAAERGVTRSDYLRLKFADHVGLQQTEVQAEAGHLASAKPRPPRDSGESLDDYLTRIHFSRG